MYAIAKEKRYYYFGKNKNLSFYSKYIMTAVSEILVMDGYSDNRIKCHLLSSGKGKNLHIYLRSFKVNTFKVLTLNV